MRAAKLIWLSASITVILSYFYFGKAEGVPGDVELKIALIIIMLILSFPSGFVFIGLLWGFSEIYSDYDDFANNYPDVEIIAVWAGCVISGYLQWFILIPVAWRKVRKQERESP